MILLACAGLLANAAGNTTFLVTTPAGTPRGTSRPPRLTRVGSMRVWFSCTAVDRPFAAYRTRYRQRLVNLRLPRLVPTTYRILNNA